MKSRPTRHKVAKDQNTPAPASSEGKGLQFDDQRPEVTAQLRLQEIANTYTGSEPIQKQENNTGLPDDLKSGVENLSGHSLEDVRVHYNSGEPAKYNAHAFAKGNAIHLASGQEKHLPHEAWHMVQQKQGRVQPTGKIHGADINDDRGLEAEADSMGQKALQKKK